MEIFAVIMAGGVGSRFWPRSRQKTPKQLLRIFGEKTMIQETVERLDGFVKKENILVITNRVQKPLIVSQLSDIPKENIIAEPFGKNTAPCIGLAAAIIKSKSDDAVMVTLPADHLIQNKEMFLETLNKSVEFANEKKGLVTIGINPTHPETGYGYIQIDEANNYGDLYKVATFAEKPNYETAKRFVESGDFLWNSGMFIWKVETIISEIAKFIPDLNDGIEELLEGIKNNDFEKTLVKVYGQVKSISIDYGVMEKSKDVYVIKGSFDWNDVGSWEAVYALSEKNDENNSLTGDIYTDKTKNSYIYSPKKFTAAIGLEDILIINTDEALLVCKRDEAQRVKNVVEYLKLHKKEELL